MGRVIEAKKDSVGPVGMLKQLRPAHEVLVREPAHGRLECTGAVSWVVAHKRRNGDQDRRRDARANRPERRT
jgi:hypothetical protein